MCLQKLFAFFTSLLLMASAGFAQKRQKDTDRGYAFEGRNVVVGLHSGFFGETNGYGKPSGVPLMLSVEYGLHRYVGLAIYGGMLHRDPIWGERRYQLDLYTGGARLNFHVYNLIDDLVPLNLRGDLVDIYGNFTVGVDHYDTDLPLRNRFTYYLTGGVGIRTYPIRKAPGLGFNMEFSTILSPWLIGVNYRF